MKAGDCTNQLYQPLLPFRPGFLDRGPLLQLSLQEPSCVLHDCLNALTESNPGDVLVHGHLLLPLVHTGYPCPSGVGTGARALAAYIDRFYSGHRVRLIFGAMRDKAIDEIAGVLFPRAAEVILTAARQAQAVAPDALREVAAHPNVRVAPGTAG